MHDGKQYIINPCIKKKLWSQLHNKQRGISCTCFAQNKAPDKRLWGWFVEGIQSLRPLLLHKVFSVLQTKRKSWPPLKIQSFVSKALFIKADFYEYCLQSQYDSILSRIWILTCYAEMNKWTCLVLPILFIDRLDIVASCIGHWCFKDHQLILQCDGSI